MTTGSAGGDQEPSHGRGHSMTDLAWWIPALRPLRSFLGVTLVSALALLGSPIRVLAEAEPSNSELEAFSRRLAS